MLSSIEYEILQHIHTYRITISEAVARLYEISKDEADDFLKALHTKLFIGSAELMPGERYYHLQPRAAEMLGLENVTSGPVNGTTKVHAYATLYFCCLAGHYRPKIPTDVFQTRFSDLYRPGPKINYYTDGANIGYLRIETDASIGGDVFRLIERCRRDIRKRMSTSKNNNSQFRELVESGRFQVTVLTAFDQKATRVRTELNRMAERCYQYNAHVDAVAKGFKRTAKHFFVEYTRWHHKNKDRKAPPPPPPMEIVAVPRLIDLIYPKPEPVAP